MTILLSLTYRATVVALITIVLISLLYPQTEVQAREGDDWVLVDRFNAQEKLAKAGNAEAMYEVARMYELGRGTETNLNKAIEWYERAIAKGQNNARAHLGVMYFEGNGVKQDLKRAVDLLVPAAEKGNPTAEYYLGHMYETGEGMHRNLNQAIAWYKKATTSGNYLAVARLKSLEAQDNNLSQLREEPAEKAMRANPPLRPVQIATDSPAKVLQQAIMDAKWERNGRPASFLPSVNTTCKDSQKIVRCQSGEEQRNTGDTIITYVTEATISGFTNRDQFVVSYSNNVHKVQAVERPGLDGENQTRKKPNIKLGKQSVVHKLHCELQSVNELFCVKDNNVSLTYTRRK